jgi:formamidopyrimidine-DNA glycosylase
VKIMPELPDLEVIREYLTLRLTGVDIASVEVRRPLVVRNLVGGEVADRLVGRRFASVNRRGKFLLLELESGTTLVINPMWPVASATASRSHARMWDVSAALNTGAATGRELARLTHDDAVTAVTFISPDGL